MAQPKWNCFAVTPPGCEELCAAELRRLDVTSRVEAGGVAFEAVPRDLYRVNLWSRVATRVLVRLGRFRCRDFPELYRQALKLPWGRFLRPDHAIQVRVSCRQSRLVHSGRVAETVQAAAARSIGVEGFAAGTEQLVLARIENDECELSIDSSGERLHRRGYRRTMVAAPLRENLAAAILLKLGYDGNRPLVDAMTGSGSFAIEAALLAAGLAPGRQRSFAFMDWPHYKPHVWTLCLQERGVAATEPASILAVDQNPDALAAARKNAEAAGVTDRIQFVEARAEQLEPPAAEGLFVCNPPYGGRLGEVGKLLPLYRALGTRLRNPFRDWEVGWVSADRRFIREMDIACRRIWSFSNGGLGVELRQRRVTGRKKS